MRSVLTCLGVGLVGLALGADALGLSVAGSFGRDQVLVLLLGGLVLALAWRRGSVAGAWRGTALLVLNTLLLVVLVELAALVVVRVHDHRAARRTAGSGDWRDEAYPSVSRHVPYYDEQAWSVEYWRSYMQAWGRLAYHPYVLWRKAPFTSETIRVDEAGGRVTPGNDGSAGAYEVLALGGSTMWGFGSPDAFTIPAYLRELLAAELGTGVRVTNLGEGGYVATQELVALMLELQRGHVPDLVIFYDGANEAYVAGAEGRAGAHYNQAPIARLVEGAPHFEAEELGGGFLPRADESVLAPERSYLVQALRRLGVLAPERGRGPRPERSEAELAALVDDTLEHYLAVHRMVGALSREYGFDYHFFWQPVARFGRKPLTEAEKGMRWSHAPVYALLYERMRAAAADVPRLHDIADVFSDRTEQLYIDGVHVLPAGNRIVAEAIFRAVRADARAWAAARSPAGSTGSGDGD